MPTIISLGVSNFQTALTHAQWDHFLFVSVVVSVSENIYSRRLLLQSSREHLLVSNFQRKLIHTHCCIKVPKNTYLCPLLYKTSRGHFLILCPINVVSNFKRTLNSYTYLHLYWTSRKCSFMPTVIPNLETTIIHENCCTCIKLHICYS